MSKRSVSPRTVATKVPAPVPPDELEQLLASVEDCCNHAAGIVSATARVIAGDELGLRHDNVPGVYAAALEHVTNDLEVLSDRALKARTTARREGR